MVSENFGAEQAQTLEMKVDNMGFLLERLGTDCAPLQFLRELTVNAIQAILSTESKQGEIIWDYDQAQHANNCFKLSIIDTGIGMTGEEMVKYINHLSCSGHTQSVEGNFGVGAKISAATRNPEGVIYISWKNGKGSMVHLWKNSADGKYGLKPFLTRSGKALVWAPVDDDYLKPKQIHDHGTVVVLLGADAGANTMEAPAGSPTPSSWVARYLNSRFFEFPCGISVKAREGWSSNENNTNQLRTVTGAKVFLDKYSESSGKVDLGDATAFWWILKDKLGDRVWSHPAVGHIAALHQNELYELQLGKPGFSMLQKFGVSLGYKRVVIYVCPDTEQFQITSNTARSQLYINGELLPWSDWADKFRAHLPRDINKLINKIADTESDPNHTKSIKERLKEIADLYRLRKYHPITEGKSRVSEFLGTGESTPKTVDAQIKSITITESDTHSVPPQPKQRTRTAGDFYSLFLKEDGIDADELADKLDLNVKWVSEDQMPTSDRAANYTQEDRTLLINRDFRVFTDFVARWQERYSDQAGAYPIIRDAVQEWFEQTLTEVVYGAEYLRGEPQWVEAIGDLLSDEALTAAVLPRYHTEYAVKKALAIRLRPLRDRTAAPIA